MIFLHRLPNGTFTGMVAEVRDNLVDTGTAGFSITDQRMEIVQFSKMTMQTIIALLVKRPDEDEPGFHYHTLEFTQNVWIVLAIGYLAMWLFMFFVFHSLKRTAKPCQNESVYSSFCDSLSLCLRTYISKVSKLFCWI